MRRFTTIILTLFSVIMLLSGCNTSNKPDNTGTSGKISVVCTIFPQFDWVRQILGNRMDNVEITLLLNGGTDLHNYQPTVDDIVKISTCDLFIYVGGESDQWVGEVLKDATNPDMVVVNLLDTLGSAAKEEEIVAGMEIEDTEGSANETAYDEHVWLSLKNAELFCFVIADALSSLDVDNAEEYKANLDLYSEKLKALDAQYQKAISTASVKTLLFCDRFPFRYLVDDYGLKYHAAFPGCSTETEASFDTIVFLAGKLDELGLDTIMVTESADQSIAKTIRSNTKDKNQQVIVLDAMQSITPGNIQSGTTYLSIMQSNLNMLKEALK